MAVELASAYISIIPETSKIAPAIKKALGEVGDGDANKTGQSMGSRISSGLSKSLKVGAAAAGGVLAAGLGVALTKGLGRLTAIENAQAKMRGLGHDTETVDAIMKNALASVKGTAFGLGEAATTAAGAVAAGIKPGKELEGVLASVANSAAASGSSMEEMGSIYNKVASLGKAQNDSLQQVADRGIPIYQALAEQMGVSTEEVFKLASAGKISFEEFETAMTSASGTVAEEMGKTFTGSLANAWAALGRVGANLLSGVFDKFAPAIQGVTGWLGKLEPVATKVGESIGVFATKVTDGLGGLFDVLVKGDFSKRFREAFGGLPGVMENIGYWARTAFDYIMGTAVPALRDVAAGFRDGEGAGGVLRSTLEGIWTVIKDVFGYVQDRVVPLISDFVTGFRDGEGAGGAFRDVLEMIGGALRTAFDFVNDTVVPVLTSMYEWVTSNKQILETLAAAVLGAYAAFKLWTISVRVHAAIMGVINAVKAAHIALSYGLVGATYASATAQRVLNAVMKANPIGILITAIGALVAALVYLYNNNETVKNAIDTGWRMIKSAISSVVTWFRDTAWPWMRDAFQSIGDKAGALKDRAKTAFDGIKNGISNAWDGAKRILDRFKDGLQSLRDKFSSVKDGIARVWSTVGAAIARPINTVIDTVNKFLENLRTNLNKIPGVTLNGTWGRIPHVPVPAGLTSSASTAGTGGGSTGPVRLADGSWVPGHSPHPRADNIPAMLTAGEFVTRQRSAERMKRRHPGALEYINRHGELPRFADGGRVGGSLGDALAGAGSFLIDLFMNPGKALQGLADKALSGLGVSWAGKAAIGAAGESMKKLATWVKDKIFGGEGPGGLSGAVGPAMGWQSIWGLVKGLFPDAILTSAVRNSTIAGTNIKSLHASGRAIDFALNPWSRMVQATRVLSGLKRWTELIHTPAGTWQQNRGVNTANFAPITRAQHYDHVHAAMADGGLVRPFVADSGALLRPGLNVLDNRTGGPEPLGRLDRPLEIAPDSIVELRREFKGLLEDNRRALVRELVTAGRAGGR